MNFRDLRDNPTVDNEILELDIDAELNLDSTDYNEVLDLVDVLTDRLAKIPSLVHNSEFQLEHRMLLRSLKNFKKFL